jgi:hypothetical protein
VSQFDRGVASYWPDDRSGEDAVRVLGAEVERLRATVADLRRMIDGLETCAHEERAAVVKWLRREAEVTDTAYEAAGLLRAADTFERGEHRSEEP